MTKLFLFICFGVQAQNFTPVTDAGFTLPKISDGSIAWGDYDNDGRLDLLLTGTTSSGFSGAITRLYHQKNDGSGFEDKTSLLAGVPNLAYSSVAWGDYDNDGRLDLIITGSDANYTSFTRLLHQRSDGTGFENKTALLPNVPGLAVGSTVWGDYDKDGKLDLLLTGRRPDGSTTYFNLYHQKADGSGFEEKSSLFANISGLGNSSLAWGDYDNDDRLDLLLSGSTDASYGGRITRIYHQKSDGSGFEDVSNLIENNIGLLGGSVAWGDYDNDGKLDFLLTGGTSSASSISRLYHQKANGSGFEDKSGIVANFINVQASSVAWGDYDNDGKLDFLLTGFTNTSGTGPRSRLYHQKSDGSSFDDVTATAVPGLSQVDYGIIIWGDYDNDDRLDFIIVGMMESGYYFVPTTQLYHNNALLANTKPSPPTSLTYQINTVDKSITFGWDKAVDDQTPSNGLNYNLYIGTQVNEQTIINPMADPNTGFRRIVRAGTSQLTIYTLKGITVGKTYYWSVQAIDTAFKGSNFAAQQSVLVSDCLQMATLKNGYWDDPTIWSCGHVPSSSDAVLIQHLIKIPANYSASALRVNYSSGQTIKLGTASHLHLGSD